MTLLSRCLSSFCTDGLVDIIAGLSAGHHRVGVHFSLPQRLVDFRKTSYAKYTVPTSFCKAVGQIGHTLGSIQSSFFFHIFLPVFYPFYCTTLLKFVYLLTYMYIFFNQNWLQCDVCLRRWSNLCTYGQFPWSGRKLCGTPFYRHHWSNRLHNVTWFNRWNMPH